MTAVAIQQEILDFYARPAAMTSGGGYAPMFEELPRDTELRRGSTKATTASACRRPSSMQC